MKKSLLVGLTTILLTVPFLGSCNATGPQDPNGNDSENGQHVDDNLLSELAKKHGCINLNLAATKASEAGEAGTKETYKICGIIKEITNNETGELVITDSKNLFLIRGIIDYKSLTKTPKIGDEIVVSGILKTYHNIPNIENATFVELGGESIPTPNPDPNPDPTPNPNPNPDPTPNPNPNPNPNTGKHEDYFVSTEVMNMGDRGNLGTVDGYYESCRGLKGYALKKELNRICQPQKRFEYKDNDKSFPFTDVDPDDPSKIVLTYTGERRPIHNYGISVNKEHTWPNSRGAGKSGPGADKHMIRPTENQINGLRSNYDFGYVEHNSTNDCAKFRPENKGNYRDTSKELFEPKDEYKGDSARMIFYLATVYNQMELEAPRDHTLFNSWTAKYTHGVFEDLYKWATDVTLDPVSKIEMNRNNVIDIKYQHNRNPFIDHPEFVEMIYSKTYNGPGALND